MIKADAEDMAASLQATSVRSKGKQQEDAWDDGEGETGAGGPRTTADRAKDQRGTRNVQKLREKME